MRWVSVRVEKKKLSVWDTVTLARRPEREKMNAHSHGRVHATKGEKKRQESRLPSCVGRELEVRETTLDVWSAANAHRLRA